MEYYDRYLKLRGNDSVRNTDFLPIPIESSDLMITYDRMTMRFDNLSYRYYGNANYGWLILQANPHWGSMEFSIPDGVTLRIPYPLTSAITRYENAVNSYIKNH